MTRPPFVQQQEPYEFPSPEPFPAFAPMISDAFDSFRDMPETDKAEKGKCLIFQDTEPKFVFLLRSGLVKLTHLSKDGYQSIVGLRASGWYAGAVSSMARKHCPYTVECVTPVVISTIPVDDFTKWLSVSAKRSRHFTMTMCNELLSQASLSQVSRQPADSRLRHFLRETKHPNPTHQTIDVEPFLKRSELAQLLSVTPEHLSRMFPRLADLSATHHPEWS